MVDDGDAAIQKRADPGRRRSMRKREKDGIDFGFQVTIQRQAGRRQVRMHGPDRIARSITTREPDQAHGRMTIQQPDQIPADIPGRADHADANRVPGRW